MHKKRYWLIGIFIFFILMGAVLANNEDPASGNLAGNDQVENTNNDEMENLKAEEEKAKNAEKEKKRKEEEERKLAAEREAKEREKKKEEKEEEKENTPVKVENLSDLKVHFVDVGQADATLFQYSDQGKNYNILFDAGDWNKTDLVTYLHSQSINSLDLVIISHPHADHIGQLAPIMKEFTVHEVWMGGNTATSQTFQRALEAVLNSDADYVEPRAGEVYDIGPLSLEVLHPSQLTGDLNQDSISIRFLYGKIGFILTGDAYKQNELEMIQRNSNLKSEILHLGHHGSNTSTDAKFLDAVKPKLAIYSASSNNSYGHPHPEVVSLIKDKGIDLYGTDVHGTILITTDGQTYKVQTKKKGTVKAEKTKSTSTTKKGKTSQSGKKSNSSKSRNKSSSASSNKSNSGSSDQSKEEKKQEEKRNDPPPASNCVNINKASTEELQEIIHIGPERAEELVKLRPFTSVDDLSRIKGIGPKRLEDIKKQAKACLGG